MRREKRGDRKREHEKEACNVSTKVNDGSEPGDSPFKGKFKASGTEKDVDARRDFYIFGYYVEKEFE